MSNLYESGEMYLETILQLKKKLNNVRSIDIVHEMGFSKPSVSIGMKKLRDGGYIIVSEEGYIDLTSSGEAVAQKILDRHNVISQILMNLGVSEQTAIDDACKIEHDISEETFLAIKKLLNNK